MMQVSKCFLNSIISLKVWHSLTLGEDVNGNLRRKISFNCFNFGRSNHGSFFLFRIFVTTLFSLDPIMSSNNEGARNPVARFNFQCVNQCL